MLYNVINDDTEQLGDAQSSDDQLGDIKWVT